MIHEIFGLTDEQAARVLVKLAKEIQKRSNQYRTINTAGVENRAERDFAAFMVGYWNGLNMARTQPWVMDREAMFVADIIRRLEDEKKDEEEVVEYLVGKFKAYREEVEAHRCRDAV